MAGEDRTILAHNVIFDAEVSSDSAEEHHEAWRVTDGLPFTWWEPSSAASHYLIVKAQNMAINGDFESNVSGWFVYKSGSGDGTFTYEPSTVIDGNGSGKFTATTANDSSDVCAVVSYKIFKLKANRTYRLSFAAKQTGSETLRFGFMGSDFSEDSNNYSTATPGASVGAYYKEITPTSDGEYRIYFRALGADTFYIDDVHLFQCRETDTLVIGKGHRCANFTVKVQTQESIYDTGSWDTWLSETSINTYQPLMLSSSASAAIKKSPMFKIIIAPQSSVSGLSAQQVPILYIGKKWTLGISEIKFTSNFDPDAEETMISETIGDRGVSVRVKKANRRYFKSTIMPITDTEYENVKMFFEDTENGLRPFFFIYNSAADILYMKLRNTKRVAPLIRRGVRQMDLDMMEIVGGREL